MFRSPLYLDLQALQNVADYFDISLPEDRQVTRVVNAQRGGKAGLRHGIEIAGERSRSEELTEVFATQARPVRAMNDVIDGLLRGGDLLDLTVDPEATVTQRALVQVEGDLRLSPATEMGAIMSRAMPQLINHAVSGGAEDDLDPLLMGRAVLGDDGNHPPIPHVYIVESGSLPMTVLAVVQPKLLFGDVQTEDLEGEFTLVGTVDRLISRGRTYSLERHVLPGLNRTFRRAMGDQALPDLVASFANLMGAKADMSTIEVIGPAILISPIAIF